MMGNISLIQNIPKFYTALAEWGACVLYIIVRNRTARMTKKQGCILVSSLILLIIVQNIIGKVNVIFWIPGMILAVMIMYMSILLTCQTDKLIAAYWLK